MPFLTQGKTNWKFVGIVLILAVIIGGGFLFWQWSPEIIRTIKDWRAETPEEKCRLAGDFWRKSDNCCCPRICLITDYEEIPHGCLCCVGLFEEAPAHSLKQAMKELEQNIISEPWFVGISYSEKEGVIDVYLENEKAKEEVPDFFMGFPVQKVVTGPVKAE